MIVNTLKARAGDFPKVLRQIPLPPAQIYWSGCHPDEWLDKPKVAIVGSRKSTAYGQAVTYRLAGDLARAGVVIISGLALGVDSIAHRAALEANGTTVAVIGTSLDQISPPSHTNLARQITNSGGTLISEYARNDPVCLKNFIFRNRIVSGLADILLITEATVKSGSLHTARFALEQGKTVMAVPGNITSPTSEGCNNLIKSGAVPVTGTSDVFFALKMDPSLQTADRHFSGSQAEMVIYELIKRGVAAQDDLAAAARLDSAQLSSALTMLEIGGYIRPAGGGSWVPS